MIQLDSLESVVSDYDCFIFDLDGCLYSESKEIGQSFTVIQKLMSMGKKVFFLTNSSGYTRMDVVNKLKKMGCQGDLQQNQMYSSSYVAASYLKKYHPDLSKFYVIGKDSIREQLKAVGFDSIGGSMRELGHKTIDEISKIPLDPQVQGVIVGLDTECTYSKLALGSLYLQQSPQMKLFATNDDSFDMVAGKKMPSAGMLLQGLLFALRDNSNPNEKNLYEPTVLGKPNPFAWELIKRDNNLPEGTRALMIGDRLDTDIKFGNRAGIDTCLVMSGCTRNFQQIQAQTDVQMIPKYILQSVDAGFKGLDQTRSKVSQHQNNSMKNETVVMRAKL